MQTTFKLKLILDSNKKRSKELSNDIYIYYVSSFRTF